MSKNLFNILSVYVTDSIGRGVENQPDISGGKFVEGILYPEGFKQRVSTETPEYMLKEMGTYPVYQTVVRDILYGAIPLLNDTIYWGISTSPDPYDDHNNGKFGGERAKTKFLIFTDEYFNKKELEYQLKKHKALVVSQAINNGVYSFVPKLQHKLTGGTINYLDYFN